MDMRVVSVLVVLGCLCDFVFVAANRMAVESRMLLVGVAVGVTASVPAALLAVVIVRLRATPPAPVAPEPRGRQAQALPLPPSVVIVSAQQMARSRRYPYAEPMLEEPQPRTFTIRGDDRAE
jgi:hypothetical protein